MRIFCHEGYYTCCRKRHTAVSYDKTICKPLLPVYDKPLLYYPLAVLQQAGIRKVLIIVPPNEMEPFVCLLGNGSQLGMRIRYVEQKI